MNELIPLPSGHGPTWAEFVQNSLSGIVPAIPEHVARSAFDALRRLDPVGFDAVVKLVHDGARGIAIFLPLIHRGRVLQACEHLDGFTPVLKKVKNGERSAFAEAVVAGTLVELGYTPNLEPTIGGKRPDSSIIVDGTPVYVEVVAPLISVAELQAHEEISILQRRLTEQNPGMRVVIDIQTHVTPEACEEIAEFVRTTSPGPELWRLPSGVLIWKTTLSNPDMQPPDLPPYLSLEHYGEDQGAGNDARVLITFEGRDERAWQIVEKETKHFQESDVNILVINIAASPSFANWGRLIGQTFLPDLHRRISAIALYYETPSLEARAMIRYWQILLNPYAFQQVPYSLLTAFSDLNHIADMN